MNSEYINKLQRSCAFIPSYISGRGKVTKVYYIDGGFEYFSHSISKIINDYCALNMRSVKNVKSICQKVTGNRCIIPLYIKESGVFIPVRTVKPCVRGDKCIGYINMKYILKVDFESSNIILKNGESIEYLDRMETIKKRIGDCTIIASQKMLEAA